MESGNVDTSNLRKFSDSSKVSAYAEEAVAWANACGILNGYKDGSLRPGGTASRAEIAKMIVTFLNQSTRAVQ